VCGPTEGTAPEAGAAIRFEVLQVASGTETVDVASLLRPAAGDAVLLLHGLGCSKESYAGAFQAAPLRRFTLCAIDFPGHGATAPLQRPHDAMGDYTKIVEGVAALLKPARLHLVAHSMSTAVGLLAAERLGERLGHFVSIEGNLVAGDCGLVSRGVAEQSLENFTGGGFAVLLAGLEGSDADDLRAWGSWVRSCDPAALHAAARSLVAWSDSGVLAEQYRRLRSRTYLYGDRGGLPDHLNGIVNAQEAHCIAGSGHFPMINNPKALWSSAAAAIGQVGGGSDNSMEPASDLMEAN
jgi:pimeloyl-ACP methyl ester carboxylesterase